MARKTEAYVDTSAFIAFLDRSDSFHPLFARLFSDPPPLVTTALVIGEGHGWFLRRFDGDRARQFLAFIEDLTPLTILPVGAEEVTQATTLIRKFNDQKLTLADAVGLAIMKKRKLKQCWSTDRHLGLNGVPIVVHARK